MRVNVIQGPTEKNMNEWFKKHTGEGPFVPVIVNDANSFKMVAYIFFHPRKSSTSFFGSLVKKIKDFYTTEE